MRKDVREFVTALGRVGWREESARTSKSHVRVAHETYGEYSLPFTPSDHRWQQNAWTDIAHQMGLSTGALKEQALGQRGTSQPIEVRKARRGTTERRPTPVVAAVQERPEPPPQVTGEGVTEVRKEAWRLAERRNQALRAGEHEAVRELDVKIAALFGERLVEPEPPTQEPTMDTVEKPKRKAGRPPKSREELLGYFHKWVEEHGSPPTLRDWEESDDYYPSYTTIAKNFGSWAGGIEAAGYVPANRQAKPEGSMVDRLLARELTKAHANLDKARATADQAQAKLAEAKREHDGIKAAIDALKASQNGQAA